MLAVLGDLIEDIAVRLRGPIRHATDTTAAIERRQGGSAANVCVAAARLGRPTRLLAQVGDDAIGRALVAELAAAGVDVSSIAVGGATGTIVVIVDAEGERTMLTDRRSASALVGPVEGWLDGVEVLHVPLYSLAGGELTTTARATIAEAHRLGIRVSIDVSSVAVLDELGDVRSLLDELAPHVVFANSDEAAALAIDASVAGAITVVKRGAEPATVHVPGAPSVDVPAAPVERVGDSTGAGDAFAAGFLTAPDWHSDPIAAVEAGHRAAAELLRARPIC